MMGQAQPDRYLLPYLQESDDLFIYHYAGYHGHVHFFRAARGRRIFIYHNVTPSHFYRGWDRHNEEFCQLGRLMLRGLTGCDLALGDSDFNRRELVAAGFEEEKTGVLPIFLAPGYLAALPTDETLRSQLRQPGVVNWLTVGRVVPNKVIEDTLRVFALYNRHLNSGSRLYVVGSRIIHSYNRALNELVAALGLEKQVVFTGRVSDAQLKTYYQTADLYFTASRHEGFCVPLIESMYFSLPILARKATAIPETLADAGVLFTRLGYEEVAQMAHLMLRDEALRRRIMRKQKERLEAFGPSQVEAALQDALAQLNLPHGKNMA
jgi:glycosyltransferase involved in cell wall biosynthesis